MADPRHRGNDDDIPWPQVRDVFYAHLEERDKALEREREALENQFVASRELMKARLERLEDLMNAHLEKKAEVLRRITDEQKRTDSLLVDQVMGQVRAGDENLLLHIENDRRAVAAAFASSEKAITKADIANDKRFASVNEFRAQLRDQATTFLRREIFDAAFADYNVWREATNVRLERSAQTATDVAALKAALDKLDENLEKRLKVVEEQQLQSKTQILMAGAFITVVVTLVVIAVNIGIAIFTNAAGF